MFINPQELNILLKSLQITNSLVFQSFNEYTSLLEHNIHEEKIKTFHDIYSYLGLLKSERTSKLMKTIIFLLNSIFDSIDDSIDDSPDEIKNFIYKKQIIVFSGFIYLFSTIIDEELKIFPHSFRKRIKSNKIKIEMLKFLDLVEIPQNEVQLTNEILQTTSLKKFIEKSCAYSLQAGELLGKLPLFGYGIWKQGIYYIPLKKENMIL